MQIGVHGMIIEFTDPADNTRRSATYLPEVAAHEGILFFFLSKDWWVETLMKLKRYSFISEPISTEQNCKNVIAVKMFHNRKLSV